MKSMFVYNEDGDLKISRSPADDDMNDFSPIPKLLRARLQFASVGNLPGRGKQRFRRYIVYIDFSTAEKKKTNSCVFP